MTQPELGVCYYPEHWPEEQWVKDATDMVSAGLTWVRIGEFAWSRMEPKPDLFDWGWLDRAIAALGEAGLKVVLGTPTATPPRWMLSRYPDMLAYDAEGHARKFGSRRHYCFSHEGYQKECARIATALGERYGQNSHVRAWQIDNEYGCHDTTLSYSPAAQAAFRAWLEAKYKTISALNAAWGNVFWSMEYGTFDEIDLPNLTVTEPNPAHVMDFRRFSSDQVVAFNRVQVEALRPHTSVPLIHNYMGRITDFDHFAVGADLDIASWDSYPLGFLEDRSDQGEAFKTEFARQGDPDFQAFHHDLYRAVGTDGWWVMEQQPGPVNWAPYNPAPLPGMVRLWTWEAIAHGADVVSYFRWRQAPFAQEQMHAGLQRPDGEDANVMAEVSRVSGEIANVGGAKKTMAPIGLVFDYASAWAWEAQPQSQSFNYFRIIYDVYRGLRRLGLSVDILPPTTESFSDRALVLIPGLFSWTPELLAAIEGFKGELVIGPRTGSKTPDFQIPTSLPPNLPHFDTRVSAVESLRPGTEIALREGGAFQLWHEFIETTETVTERTTDDQPAIVSHERTHYLAGWPDDAAMTRLLSRFAQTADLSTEPIPHGVRRRDWGALRLYMNYNATAISLHGYTLQPADILLFRGDTPIIFPTQATTP
ncbi:beta-galactosidase [Litorimonas sp. RW-G-Af-16]|uniref:beta-galactosidase n=1 Tax=Litorimonas sp. RW-G-Af-16 TaxID=3241168 RepID=UPI00390C67A7